MDRLVDIAVRAFAVYRLTHLVLFEEGPFEVVKLVHEHVDPKQETWVGRGLNCPLCVSFWMSLLVAFLPNRLALWLGLAGAIVFAKKHTNIKFLEQ